MKVRCGMSKILCPYHHDTTPSMHVYEEYSYCFVCSARVKNSKVGIVPSQMHVPGQFSIEDKLLEIHALPVNLYRGLLLPADEKGVYITWPNDTYYKKRYYKGEPRYTCPKGKPQPLLIYKGNSHLVLIEGELNALSACVATQCKETIASAGSANDMKRHIKEYLKYKTITIIVDHDAPGIAFGLEMKDNLLKHGKRATLVTVEMDYNDVLTQLGAAELVKRYRKDIG